MLKSILCIPYYHPVSGAGFNTVRTIPITHRLRLGLLGCYRMGAVTASTMPFHGLYQRRLPDAYAFMQLLYACLYNIDCPYYTKIPILCQIIKPPTEKWAAFLFPQYLHYPDNVIYCICQILYKYFSQNMRTFISDKNVRLISLHILRKYRIWRFKGCIFCAAFGLRFFIGK